MNQKEDKLVDYKETAESAKDMLEEVNGGPLYLQRIVKNDPLYDETNSAVVDACIKRGSVVGQQLH